MSALFFLRLHCDWSGWRRYLPAITCHYTNDSNANLIYRNIDYVRRALMDHALTAKEGLALDIVFGLFGQSRFNRDIDDWGTHYKYVYVALNAPKLEAMHADVNIVLQRMAARGLAPFEICYFKAGDRIPWYEPFPTSLSRETVRKAWTKSGMRELQREYRCKMRSSRRSH